MSIMQIGIVGVMGALLAVQLRSEKSEYGTYVSVAVGIVLFACIVDRLSIFIEIVQQIQQLIDIDAGYISAIIKMIGITYIAEFCSCICKDAGHQTIAMQIETFSKLTILAIGMPILMTLLQTIQEFLV